MDHFCLHTTSSFVTYIPFVLRISQRTFSLHLSLRHKTTLTEQYLSRQLDYT
jgi:hypothetical protein